MQNTRLAPAGLGVGRALPRLIRRAAPPTEIQPGSIVRHHSDGTRHAPGSSGPTPSPVGEAVHPWKSIFPVSLASQSPRSFDPRSSGGPGCFGGVHHRSYSESS
jgi:hypothetical protein